MANNNMKELTEFTVIRSQWLHNPNSPAESGLIVKDGHKCCLGFACEAMGIEIKVGMKMPYEATKEISPLTVFNSICNGIYSTDLALRASTINDSKELTMKQKEEQLTELFASNGITIKFVD